MSTREKRIHAPHVEPAGDVIRGRREQRTIHDVARRAKVSVGTVSKALNNKGRLRQETRERIIAVARAIVHLSRLFESKFVKMKSDFRTSAGSLTPG